MTFRARFEALARHPDLPDLMRHEPSAKTLVASLGFASVFGAFFVLVAMAVTYVFFRVAPPLLSILPIAAGAISIGVAVSSTRRWSNVANSSLERFGALVVDERTRVSGGGRNSSASTTYFVTLEFDDGEREEYVTEGRVAGAVRPGDIGIAYLKGGHLLDFKRVRV